jgi:pimeloyl-ACP methyl ester carboxylesterase
LQKEGTALIRIESLLSARLFLSPQRLGDRITFISNISGHLSLYAMKYGGSMPEPLLPPYIALQNPLLLHGTSFHIFDSIGKILILIDEDGNEIYQPMLIPIDGGIPKNAFGDRLLDYRVRLGRGLSSPNAVLLIAESRKRPIVEVLKADIECGTFEKVYESGWVEEGTLSPSGTKAAILDQYSFGDHVLRLWEKGESDVKRLRGIPLDERSRAHEVMLNGIHSTQFLPDEEGVLFITSLFEDTYSLGLIDSEEDPEVKPIEILGIHHHESGELVRLDPIYEDRYLLTYNIDGCSWAYEGSLDVEARQMNLESVICGENELTQGVMQSCRFDERSDSYALTFSSAVSPSQLDTVGGKDRSDVQVHTNERILGIPKSMLSLGEDASYDSFDGMRISARLYLPQEETGFEKPYPLIYYVHGGPQSQERPDFTWFSMPLIQFLTLSGFAVFVPNVRGSSGYGMKYTKLVDRDWGGDDRRDHVHAMKILDADPRVDTKRAGVVGRSYGGYMTLILSGWHPELWSAAVDMFGPYDLITFLQRIPPTWVPYFKVALGDPDVEEDRAFLEERSPRNKLTNLACPLLVIQGRNDPRVVERESRDLVEELRSQGKQIEYLMFENEGHDVLKFDNRVRCYNAIRDFFLEHL